MSWTPVAFCLQLGARINNHVTVWSDFGPQDSHTTSISESDESDTNSLKLLVG